MNLLRIAPTIVLAAGIAAAQPAPPPPPAPTPSPAPAAAPLPPEPPAPPDAFIDQDRLQEIKDRVSELRGKLDVDINFDVQAQIARAQQELANVRINLPVFGPQQIPAVFRGRMTGDLAYEAGQRALEGRRYSEALEFFNQVAAKGGSRADGAWYWKAYSLIRLGRPDEARAAIAELRKTYPSSRWLDDAKALEVEAGKPVSPENESDEELKLIALNGLMQSDPDRALPLLDGLLKGAQPPRIKRNALFVLAQSSSPKAQQMLEQIARGHANPDLQLLAIRYLGERRRQGGGSAVLTEIYGSSTDANVKRAILNSLESSRDKDRILQIARTERDSDLRLQAIRLLGSLKDGQADVWSLYSAETSPEIKQRILESVPATGNLDKMLEIARAERDARLRRIAIHNLATARAANTGDTLATLYSSDQDENVKRSIIDALYAQKNVKAMVRIARAEKDPHMQQRILERLVGMKSPEANDYLMEVIKK